MRQVAPSVHHRVKHLPFYLQIRSGRLRRARRRHGASIFVSGAFGDNSRTPAARRSRFSASSTPWNPLRAQQPQLRPRVDQDRRNDNDSRFQATYCIWAIFAIGSTRNRLRTASVDLTIGSGTLINPQTKKFSEKFVGGKLQKRPVNPHPNNLQPYARLACAAQARLMV